MLPVCTQTPLGNSSRPHTAISTGRLQQFIVTERPAEESHSTAVTPGYRIPGHSIRVQGGSQDSPHMSGTPSHISLTLGINTVNLPYSVRLINL